MPARVLVVGLGFPQLGLVRFCRAEGLHVVGADRDPRAVGAPLVDHHALVSTTDEEGLARLAAEHRVDAVVTAGSEAALLPVARVARRLGLRYPAAPETLAAWDTKEAMRRLQQAGGAPVPPWTAVSDAAAAEPFLRRHGLPVVVKPTRGWGQRGVRVVKTADELERAVREALAVAARVPGTEPRCLVEGFIEGREYSVNAYTVGGATQVLAVTERIITGWPDPPGITFAEVHPSGLDDTGLTEVIRAAELGVRALGIDAGPTYTQVRHGPSGAFLVETAWRLGGGLDPDVTFLASGVSLYRRVVGHGLGRSDWEGAGPEAPRRGGAIGRFLVAEPGIVVSVAGLEEARAVPGVVDAAVYVGPGDVVQPLTDGSKRAGHVLAWGADRSAAEAAAARALGVVRVAVTRDTEA